MQSERSVDKCVFSIISNISGVSNLVAGIGVHPPIVAAADLTVLQTVEPAVTLPVLGLVHVHGSARRNEVLVE